ncbi:MAG: STAS domain-containing protein [Acidobacteriota bacterium]
MTGSLSSSPNRLEIAECGSNALSVSGEIDAHSAPVLAERFATLSSDAGDVVVDLSGVTFMDSSGLRELIELQQRVGTPPNGLVLQSPSQTVLHLLEVAGLDGHFTVAH